MDNSLHNLLSRNLSGVYRDPQRIHRDASNLLTSPLGRHLRPTTQPLTSNDGSITPSVLMLQGTLPMTYRNVTYNIPIDIYLPSQYPQRPPIVYVRPVSNMAIKENHRHVGNDGRVYMPYLHEWQMNTSDLRELAVWMSSLFGSEPPCYAKPVANVGAASSMSSGGSGSHRPPAYAQATTTQSVTSNNSHSSYASSSIASSNNNNNSSSSNNRRDEQQQRQRQQQIEKEIAEANLAAKVAREASLHEAQLAEQQSKLKHQHEQQVSSMKVMAISKVQYELTHGVFHNVKDDLRITLHNQKLLDYGRKEELEVQIKEGEERKEELRGLNMEMEESVKRLEEWLEIAERQQQQQKGGEGEEGGIDVDSMAIPTDTHSAQMLQLSAENAAIDDCIYFLDQSMARGNIPLDVFLKEVRKLSRRQFMAKAHLIKISQAKAMTSSSSR